MAVTSSKSLPPVKADQGAFGQPASVLLRYRLISARPQATPVLISRTASCISCLKHRNDVQIVTGTKAAS